MSDRKFSRGGNGGGNNNNNNGGGGGIADLGLTSWDETSEQKPARDLKKTFLVAGLAILSWVATYVGMLELIEANIGDLPIVHKIIIGFSVAMLMTMVVWLLDQLFQPHGFVTKLSYAFGYLFLSIISIGFGFGFYWKVLESRGEGTRGAEMAIASVYAPLQTAAQRLDSLQTTLVRLKDVSQSKAELERTSGTSCPNSKPGDGPRRKLRDDDAGRFSFASDFVKTRIGQVQGDMGAIEADLAKIVQDDKSIIDKHGTRNDFMKSMNRKLDGTVTNFNAFRGDPQLKTIRTELAERADKSTFTDTQGKPYSCPDQQLATMIRSVVASIDALPVLEKPKITTVEGSDATIEAFRRLTASFYGLLSFKLPPSSDELRELQKKAMTQAEATAGGKPVVSSVDQLGQGGLSKRDYVPLAIAIFVDLCLLLVSMGKTKSRLQGLVPKMKEAERGPVIQILSRFNEIHRDRQIRENFEIFRHVVFDFNGDYYAAIPLIAPYAVDRRRPNAYGPADVEALQQEAHLLANFFTSFEHERLYSRVMMPLIPVSRIQKKLWAQGSKFAHAESFRLYKFKDGAWQEMILGAIMGAAKRVETEKRTRRIENDVFTRNTPGFDQNAPENTARTTASFGHGFGPSFGQGFNHATAHGAGLPQMPFSHDPSEVPAPATRSFAPGVPRPSQPPTGRPVAPPPPPAPPSEPAAMEPPARSFAPRRQPDVIVMPAAAAFAEVAVLPANSNTATVASAALGPDPRKVEVEARERSVTYRMSPDELPASLMSALATAKSVPVVADAMPTLALPQSALAAADLPAPETKEFFDTLDAQAIEKDQAETLGGRDEPALPAWNTTDPVDAELDVASITRRFGLNRQRA